MFSTVLSAAVYGVQSRLVHVEADSGEGLPAFTMVGYLSTQVREAQDRVRTALKNSGMHLTPKKITVNLAPADLHKSGTGFDLPIAVAVAASYGLIKKEALEETLIVGELSLNGRINPIPGILPMAADAIKCGCRKCIVPEANRREAEVIGDLQVVGVSDLQEVMEYLQQGKLPEKKEDTGESKTKEEEERLPDFGEVYGQEAARRAALVAAAGGHNLLLLGPPGAGKSMIARRLPTILPQLTRDEAIELSKVYSVMGLLSQSESLLYNRPFRSPHHTITAKALCGGGNVPKPGEISMAHHGVLFLDELPEFDRETLETLRQPMENKEIDITRNGYHYTFPADFMLVAAMNPCPCGYYPDMSRCRCSYTAVKRYLGKVSMPLLDRIDLTIEVSGLSYEEMEQKEAGESSESMRQKVLAARQIQKERYEGLSICTNSHISSAQLEEYCSLGKEETAFMKQAFETMRLSARGYHKILRVARTIADLDGEEQIRLPHLQEALCYRSVARLYQGGPV